MAVLVPSDEPMFPGCEVECRLIGVIKAMQREREKENRNDRIIAVAEGSILYAGVKQLQTRIRECCLRRLLGTQWTLMNLACVRAGTQSSVRVAGWRSVIHVSLTFAKENGNILIV